MSDEEFSDYLNLTDSLARKIVHLLRKRMAEWLHCSRQELIPDLSTKAILNSRWAPITGEDILPDFEHELSCLLNKKIKLDESKLLPFSTRYFPFLYRKKGAKTFGEWVLNITEYTMTELCNIKEN